LPHANIFKEELAWFRSKLGGYDMAKKSKKAKAAGLEQHRQAQRAKKLKKKEKKKVTIPANYRKR
jgi:hypothetical protein